MRTIYVRDILVESIHKQEDPFLRKFDYGNEIPTINKINIDAYLKFLSIGETCKSELYSINLELMGSNSTPHITSIYITQTHCMLSRSLPSIYYFGIDLHKLQLINKEIFRNFIFGRQKCTYLRNITNYIL